MPRIDGARPGRQLLERREVPSDNEAELADLRLACEALMVRGQLF
jgi:hypothetical protein